MLYNYQVNMYFLTCLKVILTEDRPRSRSLLDRSTKWQADQISSVLVQYKQCICPTTMSQDKQISHMAIIHTNYFCWKVRYSFSRPVVSVFLTKKIVVLSFNCLNKPLFSFRSCKSCSLILFSMSSPSLLLVTEIPLRHENSKSLLKTPFITISRTAY